MPYHSIVLYDNFKKLDNGILGNGARKSNQFFSNCYLYKGQAGKGVIQEDHVAEVAVRQISGRLSCQRAVNGNARHPY
eukprot:scaffold34124_cov122-Amphora_coffeaeformis.AAC.1